MALLKCKMCGGTLEIDQRVSVATCAYCGTQQTVSKGADDITQNLFNRANDLRIKCEFDRAEQTYEKILDVNNNDAEAHWGLVLCRFGIEYVTDPATGKKLPTCHRASFDSILADADYLSAIELADAQQKDVYIREAKQISAIQENILRIAKNEEPFDVFLCYKETDEAGKRTVDSVYANDIYYQLTEAGYKVFYAPITLEDKLGQEYEPYIFAALNSAKIMLVIGTKPEHFQAVWVKNEWGRFLNLLKKDRSKLLIPCYKDMDPYDLPDQFSHLQAQDMGKIGFINDVVRGIKKVIVKEAEPVYAAPAPPVVPVIPQQAPASVVPKQTVAPVAKPANTASPLLDIAKFTKPQFIVFLLSVLGCLALTLLYISFPDGSDRFFSSSDILRGYCGIVTLALFIRAAIKKKKDLGFAILAVLIWGLAGNYDIVGVGCLAALLLCCAPSIIPVWAEKLKWVRFFFWVPAALFFINGFVFSMGSPVGVLYIPVLVLFTLAAVPPIKKNSVSSVSPTDAKKVSLKSGIALSVFAILFALIFPYASRYLEAQDYWQSGAYESAIYCYEEYDLISEDELLEKKYIAATDKNTIRYYQRMYMEELASYGYRDAKELWEEMTKWSVEIAYCNTQAGDHTTNLGYIPKNCNYLLMGFTLYGGKSGERITVYHKIKWPGENFQTSSWDWENREDEGFLGLEYSSGYNAEQTGDFVIEFYNKATDELIDTITIPVR